MKTIISTGYRFCFCFMNFHQEFGDTQGLILLQLQLLSELGSAFPLIKRNTSVKFDINKQKNTNKTEKQTKKNKKNNKKTQTKKNKKNKQKKTAYQSGGASFKASLSQAMALICTLCTLTTSLADTRPRTSSHSMPLLDGSRKVSQIVEGKQANSGGAVRLPRGCACGSGDGREGPSVEKSQCWLH